MGRHPEPSVGGKEVALAAYAYHGLGQTATEQLLGRVGIVGLGMSTAYDLSKTIRDFHACRSGR